MERKLSNQYHTCLQTFNFMFRKSTVYFCLNLDDFFVRILKIINKKIIILTNPSSLSALPIVWTMCCWILLSPTPPPLSAVPIVWILCCWILLSPTPPSFQLYQSCGPCAAGSYSHRPLLPFSSTNRVVPVLLDPIQMRKQTASVPPVESEL